MISPIIGGEVSGSGDGTVRFNVEANNGAARVGGVTVLGRLMTFPQQTNLGEDPGDPEIYEAQSVPLVAQLPFIPTAAGNGLRGAIVSLVDQNGQPRSVRTNAFGYFLFDEIEVGNTVTLSVTSKRYTFLLECVINKCL